MPKTQVVAAIIQKESRFLLGRRSPAKLSAAGYWSPISGRIEVGETEQEAIVRECFEEVGLVVRANQKVTTFDTHDRSAEIHWWTVDVVSGEPFLKNDEHTELRWFAVNEMDASNGFFSEDIELFRRLDGAFGGSHS